MKTLATLIVVFLATLTFAQTDCRPYVPQEKGAIWEVTSYSAKDKKTGRTVYELVDKIESGKKTTFVIKTLGFDDKDKQTYEGSFEAYCNDGHFEFNMEMMMNGEQMAAYKDMDVEMDASEFVIPTMDEPVGSTLPDGELKVAIANNGMNMMNMVVNVTDRTVDSREEITTGAGSFDCILLSQKIKTKMVVNIESSTKEWYSENVGMVRSESYNKKGKLTGYTELTKLGE